MNFIAYFNIGKMGKITITRKKVKNINLRIDKEGNLKVSAPLKTDEKLILEFIESKKEWIEKHSQRYKAKGVFFAGEDRDDVTKEQAEDLLKKRFNLCCQKCGQKANLEIKPMKGKYGCYIKSKNLVILNERLSFAPIECIDYVIIHELMHILRQDHSKEFHRLINAYVKNSRFLRNELSKYPI